MGFQHMMRQDILCRLLGDVNGDGKDDIIGGSSASPGSKTNAGQAYIVFSNTLVTGYMELSSLNGYNGFTINGIASSDNAGYSVASAGDINNDGFDDIIIGAPYADPGGRTGAGQAYIIFGKSTFPSSLDLSVLDGTNGFVINSIA